MYVNFYKGKIFSNSRAPQKRKRSTTESEAPQKRKWSTTEEEVGHHRRGSGAPQKRK
jgi:hypothetical protein